MADLSKYQRDVVIRCNHGVTDGPNDYVERYRFKAERDVWESTDPAGSVETEVGRGDDDWLPPGKQADVPRHHQTKIRCRTCGKELSITGDRLQQLLAMVAPVDEPVTIAGLQRTVALWSSSAKPRRSC